jgi:hypothetical protein
MTAGPEGECLRRATHDRARDRSRTAETPCGSVHESPVRHLPHAPCLLSNAMSPRRERLADAYTKTCSGWVHCERGTAIL